MVRDGCICCGGEEFEAVLTELDDYEYGRPLPGLALIRCRQCGLLRLDPLPSTEELAGCYPAEYSNIYSEEETSPLKSTLIRIYNRRLMKSFERLAGNEADILDVGCSGGHLIGLLSDHKPGWRTTGVEMSGEAVEYGRAKGRNIIHGAIEDVDMEENSFDLILLSHLIEHVVDPRAMLAKLGRLARPGGKIIIETPDSDAFDRRLFGRYWGGLHFPRHTYLFNKNNMARMLTSLGLRASRAERTAHIFGWALSLDNILAARGWAAKTRGRTPYYPFLMTAALPVVLLQRLAGRTAAMNVIAVKPA